MVAQIEETKSTFVILNNITLARYFFVYKENDGYLTNELSKFHNKHQLLFHKLENKNQHLNLMFVDSVFVNILADVTLEVFLNKTNSFAAYSTSKNKIKLVAEKDESRYFKYKFFRFIHMLLYSNIASNNIFNGQEFFEKIYCLKNKFGEIDYFSIYEHTVLQEKLLDELKLDIDISSSSISKHEVKLCLKISY